jgi:ferredoxin-NADP reductase
VTPDLLTARLVRKQCLSASAQCFHLDFVLDGQEDFVFTPGQFVSVVAQDTGGKQRMRAYSIASAPRGNRFALCLNRVEDGFFSNRLADMQAGDTMRIQSPLGYFTLREPLTDSILIATGTGIAPMRGFVQWLFPAEGPDRSAGHGIWLIYGTRHATELYYRDEFEAMAARHANFHYLPTLSRPTAEWSGLRGYVQEHVARVLAERGAAVQQHAPELETSTPAGGGGPDIHAYVCGLSPMIHSVRERLKELGWNRKQIIAERYD